MKSDLEQRLREALHDDAARARLVNPDRPADPDARSRPAAVPGGRSRWRVVATAAAIVLLAAAGAVLIQNARDRETKVTTSPDPADSFTTTTEPATTPEAARPTTLAKGEDVTIAPFGPTCLPSPCSPPPSVEIVGFSELVGQTLNIDAMQQDGEVTGDFRVNNVVVTLQCADVSSDTRDLILGGEVTDDPDGQGLLVDPWGHRVAEGEFVALIIRQDDDRDRITLFDPTLLPPPGNDPAGSCAQLVESVPGSLDGGFFNDVADGSVIETEPFSRTLAKGEDVKIAHPVGLGGIAGRTLNVDAVKDNGDVTGEFRIDGVVVTIQCAGTRWLTGAHLNRRDLILGGEVTETNLATLGGVNVAVGDRVALIIRGAPAAESVTLYHPSIWYGEQADAGSCTELVESVPPNLDGGFFLDVEVGDIETG